METGHKNNLEIGLYFIPELTCDKDLPFLVNLPLELAPIELSSSTTHNEVAVLVASLLDFNDLNFDLEFFNALEKPHELALTGGLGFCRNEDYIGPSCCSEFQDWRGVKSSLERRANYWMGHDLDPYFEFSDSNIVLWNDEINAQVRFSVAFSINEFRLAEVEAQKKLEGFASVVTKWAQSTLHSQAELFVKGMENYLLNPHHYYSED